MAVVLTMELKKFDLSRLTEGQISAIWLTEPHHATLKKIVARGGDLFRKIITDRDLRKVDPADFYAALAMSGDAFTRRRSSADCIDELGPWSDSAQGHDFWSALGHLLDSGRGGFDDSFPSGFTLDDPEYTESDIDDGNCPDHSFRFNPLSYDARSSLYDYRTDPATTKQPTISGDLIMSTTSVIAANKAALVTATQLKAGSVLNAAAIASLKKSGAVPMMLRGYLDTPFAAVVVANVANVAAGYTTNTKVKQAASLMMQAAAVDVVNLVDIEGMITKLIDDPTVANALSSVGQAE